MQCQMCGADEESVNYVLFECPLALQTWVISNMPSYPGIFPTQSVFTNMDYLFWRLPKEPDLTYFPWILWYIWKNRNDKIFKNKTGNPLDILRKAEIEGTLWAKAQINDSSTQDFYTSIEIKSYMVLLGVLLMVHGRDMILLQVNDGFIRRNELLIL